MSKSVAKNDKIVVTDTDGNEVDLSHWIKGWELSCQAGDIRILRLELQFDPARHAIWTDQTGWLRQ